MGSQWVAHLADVPREPGTETWYLVTWRFREGTFERVASGSRDLRYVSISPALMD